jgi:hypothetical protein
MAKTYKLNAKPSHVTGVHERSRSQLQTGLPDFGEIHWFRHYDDPHDATGRFDEAFRRSAALM